MDLLNKISGQRILVVGDVMLDRYWWGSVSRISPEAPVPIVQMEKTSLVAGGAANVAANLAGLGVIPILFGIRGHDAEGEAMDALLTDSGIEHHHIFALAGRKTSIKTRIVAHSQHVVRIDSETTEPIAEADADLVLSKLSDAIKSCDAVIVSDYAKGFLTENLLREITTLATSEKRLLAVDPKGRDFTKYRGASVITPNKREAADATGLDMGAVDLLSQSGERLIDELKLGALLITEGEDGMTLFESGKPSVHFGSLAQNVYDVTGAGDTVIAAFTAGAATGASFSDAAQLANAAAGLVVGKIGTTRITSEMLSEYFHDEERPQHLLA